VLWISVREMRVLISSVCSPIRTLWSRIRCRISVAQWLWSLRDPTKAKACWKIAFEENKHKAMKSLLIGCLGDVANALNSFVQRHSTAQHSTARTTHAQLTSCIGCPLNAPALGARPEEDQSKQTRITECSTAGWLSLLPAHSNAHQVATVFHIV
jgi:hypothetical protein